MFSITNTRIVGLIAVVCAVIVAPQALATTNTHSRLAPPGDPSDVIQRYELRGELSDQSPMGQPANNTPGGIDLSDLKNGWAAFTTATPDAAQGNDLSGLDPSILNGIRAYQQHEEYLRGRAQAALAAAGLHTSSTAGSTAAAIKALQRRSVDLDAAYRKLYPGAYRQPVRTSNMPTNPGWGAAATAAKESAAALAVKTAPVVCLGQAEYEYVYNGC